MDLAYNQHADRARRKNRSGTNINHLSLAPLTAKLPLNDGDDVLDSPAHPYTTSYLQGKSAPTTPRLLSRSATPSRSRSHQRVPSAPGIPITKSVSTTHLAATSHPKRPASGTATPRRRRDDALDGGTDSDWLLRTGALMSSEAREYKGQAWLVSRQSSTSLTGMRDADEEAFELELARERDMASRLASRRGSSVLADDDATPNGSRFPSRFHSRSHSMAESHSHAGTPLDRPDDGEGSYFPGQDVSIVRPDFVDLDEKLEELELDTSYDDEATVRRLVRRGLAGKGSWISNVIGWSLFSVDEDDEHSADDDDDEDEDDRGGALADEDMLREGRTGWSARHFEGVSNAPPLERIPPPATDAGGWKDAAWLLSVASKVVF
ncbi:hypothetical protein HRG_000905 [Hirsutella rhossiliensis]|uniref:Uncharacterized protein n=1 Tax=Hirsutella rhossiliensis TaxID=111463 RepID=A0A9P8N5Z2_9HYPO|nr:uncharacterized protein HRG_00905 [Hirsutella rhossiliensis]KAH0968263.1 hypothetical protein HRG_00905 [Hirsutella rhossiliensis]